MSNETNETITDIVAEMMDESHAGYASFLEWVGAKLRHYADRIEAAEKRADDQWRAAFAKIEAVVTLQYAKRNLGDKGKKAVAEIMSACRFPDGALDEYERAFAENASLRTLVKEIADIVDAPLCHQDCSKCPPDTRCASKRLRALVAKAREVVK